MSGNDAALILVVGEIIIDFTIARPGAECKLRLGGIVHAARGLWASGVPYSVAAVCPGYIVDQAQRFLVAHGCQGFIWLGEVKASPNVIVIGDATEVSDQGYEDLLREEKIVGLRETGDALGMFSEVLIFPGCFDLAAVSELVSAGARVSIDIAYDTEDFASIECFAGRLGAIAISTSSPLFARIGSADVEPLVRAAAGLGAEAFLLKENRGGSRLFDLKTGEVENVAALLSSTVNSVGVGDVYSSVMVGYRERGWKEAAWRGARAATSYALTTYPDDFRDDVRRELALTLDEMRDLGGTLLPWHARPSVDIYLAAPDFSYVDKPEVDRAVEALRYHNFTVRRPIEENGELPRGSSASVLRSTFAKDLALLDECKIIFAVPLDRDPGTLVEMGIAMAGNKPVITFDPRRENHNTMVAGGSASYSDDLDICLNGLFVEMSKLWMASR